MMEKREATELLVRLVNASSEPGRPMRDVLGVVRPILEDLCFDITVEEHSLCPTLLATHGDPVLLMSGHLDTVDLGEGWTHGQGEVVGDTVYGRGALDMKGPCVSMLLTAERLVGENIGCAITFTTDEEIGMLGADRLAQAHPELGQIPLAIICEPTNMRPAIAEKGVLQFRVQTWGKSAHASMPELGSNALTSLVHRLSDLLDAELFGTSSQDPVSVNLANISGGNLINVIPDSAKAELDIRFSAEYTADEMLGIVKKLLRADHDLLGIEVLHELPPFRSEISPDFLAKIENYLGEMAYSVPYGTEMVKFGPVNPNILILGPGIVELAHRPDEHIDINEVMRAVKAYVDMAKMVTSQ
jgi:succinyl-diaminopimelate desuccinylase